MVTAGFKERNAGDIWHIWDRRKYKGLLILVAKSEGKRTFEYISVYGSAKLIRDLVQIA